MAFQKMKSLEFRLQAAGLSCELCRLKAELQTERQTAFATFRLQKSAEDIEANHEAAGLQAQIT